MSKEKFPVPTPEAIEQAGKISRFEETLNNPEFLKFLSSYPDAESLELTNENAEEIEKRHEAFMFKEWARDGLKDLYTEEIYKKAGLEIKEKEKRKEFKFLDEYLEKEAIETPELVKLIAENLQQYRGFNEKIEKETLNLDLLIFVSGYKPEYESLKAIAPQAILEKVLKETKLLKEEKLKTVGWREFFNIKSSELIGWFFRNKEDEMLRQTTMEKLESDIELLELTKEARQRLELAKKFLIETLPTGKMVREKVQKKVAKIFGDFLNPESEKGLKLENLQDAKKYLKELERTDDALKLLEKTDKEKLSEELDRLIENKVTEELIFAIYDKKLNPRPLEEMEQIIEENLKTEGLGPTAKRRMFENLEVLTKNPRLPLEKRILLKRLLATKSWFEK